ncbi:P27 family predicted phage terminase small subunit [Saccharothrix ecbatanensis]|uniref:P27 family predicted phage terminase small subunit n=1 Tax=Saccharothrix ecbatanensis TaxID=1105145 RepID=A0A7W9HLU1_9PSEU|nr:phage terminase small subunit P27 family [Saccharothrix ecbatanensis]MBB5804664.1 P27 family predicted phage terminase small subunit [Saccharothrix ecbatanensis]
MAFDAPDSVIGKALDEWNRLLPYMKENEYDVAQNVQPYASYCIAVKRRDECETAIDEQGLLVDSRQDTYARNPATLIQQGCNQTILEISKRFGFTPADKKALAQEDKSEETEEVPDYMRALLRK